MASCLETTKDIKNCVIPKKLDLISFGVEPTEEVGKYDPRNKLNDLTSKEWIQDTRSVWFQKGLGSKHEHAQIERQHPAPFSFQDVGRLIRFFTKKGDLVLDPFTGVASTLKACALNNRRGIGIELIKKWGELGKERLNIEVPYPDEQEIIIGDAREELLKIADESIDYIVTSPPYWRILGKKADHKVKAERINNGYDTKYSEDVRDLGNIEDYREFVSELKTIFDQWYRVLKTEKYASIIVSDFRHKSEYVPFHSDIIVKMTEAKFMLKGITVLVQNQKRLYPYGYPYAYVPNIHHQYILTFSKEKV